MLFIAEVLINLGVSLCLINTHNDRILLGIDLFLGRKYALMKNVFL